jgi:hypothetical protein
MNSFTLKDGFDEEYCQKAVHKIGDGIFRSYHSIQFPQKYKDLVTELGTHSLYYASLHKSHFDYIVLCYTLFTEGLPYSRPLSGMNLFQGPIGALMEKKTKINIRKWGAIPMERGGPISRNLAILCRHLEGFLKSGKSVLFFPEMETIENRGKPFIKTGRSYTGQARFFAPGLFGPPIQAARDGKAVYIIPTSVAYDFIAEDRYFQSLNQAAILKHADGFMPRLLGNSLYLLTESAFFSKVYRLGQGDIYIDLGRPIRVDPSVSKKELARGAFEEAARSYRVTMPALVSYFINQGITDKTELAQRVENASAKLQSSAVNFQVPEDIRKAFSETLNEMTQRGLLKNGQPLLIRKPEAIRYYANTVAHHLDGQFISQMDNLPIN